MKIGPFAKRYNLPISTIRHYIDLGLLTPGKNVSQYEFSENDCSDMGTINELKELGFYLSEIQQYLSMLRLYEEHDSIIQEKQRAFLSFKQEKLLAEQKKIARFSARLNHKLQSLQLPTPPTSPAQDDTEPVQGLPLDILPYLACPCCQQSLRLDRASIVENRVLDGQITCTCGYSAIVENGILFTGIDESLERNQIFVDGYYGGDAFLENFDSLVFKVIDYSSAGYLTTFYKTSLWIYDILEKSKRPFSFVLFPDISIHLLYRYSHSSIFKDKHIIVTALSKKAIQDIRIRLQLLNPDLKITYIINHDGALPLKPKLLDLIVDYYGTCNLSFFMKNNYFTAIDRYVADGATLVGAFDYYSQGSKSHSIIKELYPLASPEVLSLTHLHKTFRALGWKLQNETEMGNSTNPGHYFEYHAPGELRHAHAYYAMKPDK